MFVKQLHIEKRPSYDSDYPNQLVGTVDLQGTAGSQSIRLSNTAIAKIFELIAAEVHATAARNASAVKHGMTNAAHEGLAHEAQTIKTLDTEVPF